MAVRYEKIISTLYIGSSKVSALIAGVDRILDMMRTTVNITGDSLITMLVDKSEGTMDLEQ